MNSLVVVLPTLPVTPTILIGCSRQDEAGQVLQGPHGVGGLDQGEPGRKPRHRARDDGAQGAPGRGVGNEVVAVALRHDGEEEVAGPDAARIDGESGDDRVAPTRKQRPARGGRDPVQAQSGHVSATPSRAECRAPSRRR